MKAADANDDTKAMTPNDGGTLGQNMDRARKKRPDAKSVRLTYTKDHLFVYLVGKEDEEDEDDPDEGLVQSYRETKKRKRVTYKLQYAPHVMSWLSQELDKPSRLITQDEVDTWAKR